MNTEIEAPPPISVDRSEHPFIFMGGVGYDDERNRRTANAIIDLTGHSDIVTTPNIPTNSSEYDTVVFVDNDGKERELPGRIALKQLEIDTAQARYTRLQESRAEQLITNIETAGGKPVDAVFQSADTSVGILAMLKRPDLFHEVILLDPSSIIKLPPRLKYLKEELRNGNILALLRHRKGPEENTQMHNNEPQTSFRERLAERVHKAKKTLGTRKSGITSASYVSYQASMLHDISQMDNAPKVSILSSRFDHAYNPLRLLDALISLDDINRFFISNSRHGLAKKPNKLEQLASIFSGNLEKVSVLTEKIIVTNGIPKDYIDKILSIVNSRKSH